MILYCDTCGKRANITTNGMCDACYYLAVVVFNPDTLLKRLESQEKYMPVKKKDKNK